MQIEVLKDILEKQPRRKEIDKAIEIEQKSMFFTDPIADISNCNGYKYKFLRKVSDRLNNPDSYNNFINNLTFPLKINEFIESIYTKIGNIWQGQNPFYEFSFSTDSIEDYFQYVNVDYFKEDVWDEFKTHYNSIIITDLPEKQEGERPDPYNTIIRIQQVVDVFSVDNHIKHVIFECCDKLVVIDNESYQLYNYTDSTLGALEVDSPHDLGRCPAVWLSQLDFNTKSNIVKSNAISKSLGKIEDLQIIYTLKNILSPYAFYQFIVKYKNASECNYDDGKNYCDGGYLKNKETDEAIYVGNEYTTQAVAKCPQCNKNPGVGDVLGKPMPISSDEPDLKNVIEFVAPKVDILEYGDQYIIDQERDLFDNIVGTDQTLNPNQNHNELAYKYNTEGQQDVIFRWKGMFENVISHTLDNVLQLRYDDLYQGNSIDLGTEFILADINTLLGEKKELRELGLEDVFNINEAIINARYQNNPEKKKRALIIAAFKPFDESIVTVEASFKDGLIDKKDYIKQKYLKEFIKWFEAKRIKLEQFPKDQSAERIAETLDLVFDDWYNEKFNTRWHRK
jgi:hypothetical protein